MSWLISHAYEYEERRGWITVDAVSYCSLNHNAHQLHSYNEHSDTVIIMIQTFGHNEREWIFLNDGIDPRNKTTINWNRRSLTLFSSNTLIHFLLLTETSDEMQRGTFTQVLYLNTNLRCILCYFILLQHYISEASFYSTTLVLQL